VPAAAAQRQINQLLIMRSGVRIQPSAARPEAKDGGESQSFIGLNLERIVVERDEKKGKLIDFFFAPSTETIHHISFSLIKRPYFLSKIKKENLSKYCFEWSSAFCIVLITAYRR